MIILQNESNEMHQLSRHIIAKSSLDPIYSVNSPLFSLHGFILGIQITLPSIQPPFGCHRILPSICEQFSG